MTKIESHLPEYEVKISTADWWLQVGVITFLVILGKPLSYTAYQNSHRPIAKISPIIKNQVKSGRSSIKLDDR